MNFKNPYKGPISEACEDARKAKWRWQEDAADSIAWAMSRELKGSATDYERERLADAIREFLS